MLTHTHVLTLIRSIPSQSKHIKHHQLIPIGHVGIYKNAMHYKSVCANTYTCTNINLKRIHPPQWEHIKHRQLIPIGQVGIYKNAMHYKRVCANTYTCTDLKQINPLSIETHRQLIPIGEVGIYKNAIHTLSESVC